jgi:mRNA interferase MazF
VALRRGDLVTVALPGAYGKPRPALVIQSDLFDQHPSITILPITSELRDMPLFRVAVAPSAGNGLRKPSQVIVDKAQTVPREKLGSSIGRLEDDVLLSTTRALAVFVGIA